MSILQQLEIKASLKILKPIDEVFEAVVDPEKMSGYFISMSTGRLQTGATVTWQFPEFDMQIPIRVKKVDSPGYISFYWSDMEGSETLVEITLKTSEDKSTFVTVNE